MQSEYLIENLSVQIEQIIIQAKNIKTFDLEYLSWRENQNAWNILECLEHLNLYGDFYLPAIQNKIKNSKTNSESDFQSGLLGNYFTKAMLPKKKGNKMKTFKDKNPLNTNLDKKVIDRFIEQLIKLLDLLEQSKRISLNKIKIQTSISSLIKLKLGDAFQFYINHIIRHLEQIQRIEKKIKNNTN